MILLYTLSMPNNNAWNGKWTGNSKSYTDDRKVNIEEGKKILAKAPFFYNFGDGWRAKVDVKQVTRPEAAKAAKKSDGFCGYNWMITSIIIHNNIQI